MGRPFQGKKIALLGLGQSGPITAHALMGQGAQVYAWDDDPETRKKNDTLNLKDLLTLDWGDIDVFVLSPGIPHTYPAPHPVARMAKAHGLSPIGDIECFLRTQPDALYIGVTGTNGKSTTSALIAHLLNHAGKEVYLGGNIGVPVFSLPLKKAIYVFELSSYQLELTPSLKLKVGVLLNLSPDHLERHGGLEGYILAKKRILEASDKLVMGIDDPFCKEIFESLSQDIIPISTQQKLPQGIYSQNSVLYNEKGHFLSLKGLSALRGTHNAENCAAALGVTHHLGLTLDQVKEGFHSFPGLAHRQEQIACWQGITYVNDSKATNGEAVARALACYGSEYTLYWIGGGRPKECHLDALQPLWAFVKHAFLIGEAVDMFALILKDKNVPYTLSHTLPQACEEATFHALQDKAPHPLVLLSPGCLSFDQFKNFEHRGDCFRTWVHQRLASCA